MNTTRTHTEEIRNEIETLSNVLNPGGWAIDYQDEVNAWLKTFYCLNCRNHGRENFIYLSSHSHGEDFLCDNCSCTVSVTYEPKPKPKPNAYLETNGLNVEYAVYDEVTHFTPEAIEKIKQVFLNRPHHTSFQIITR